MGTVTFRRQRRVPGPELPAGELKVKAPPELPQPQQRNLTQVLMMLPMVLMMGAMVLMMMGRFGRVGNNPGGNGIMSSPFIIIGGMFGLAMLAMVGVAFMGGRGENRQKLLSERRDYMRYLGQCRRQVRRAADQQRSAMLWRHPRHQSLWNYVHSRRMWERRPVDDDFAEVRLAVGKQRLAVQLATEETKTLEDLEPMSAIALRRFVKAQSTVRDIPMALQLRSFRRLSVRGDNTAAHDLVRAMLGELAVFHSPEDVIIAAVVDPSRRRDWDWLKWLPHNMHFDEDDAAGPRRLVVGSFTELETMLDSILEDRSRVISDAATVHEGAHIVVVNDGVEVSAAPRLSGQGLSGTTVIEFEPELPKRMMPWFLALDVTRESVSMRYMDTVTPMGKPDGLSVRAASALARHLSRYRLAEPSAEVEPLAVSMELPDLLGIGDAGAFSPRRVWNPHKPNAQRLHVPVGLDPDGNKILLDFKEAAQGGMGPHGLIIGATGSGKSEMLRTIVLALACTHSSEELNFVLVDFKGGATFATLDRLPHTSAVITNLADELPLVDRMADAINGELVRRQELLRAAGNYVSQRDYERERRAGAALAPMPSLMIICDEFSELLSAQPDFINLFVQIGRVGRSLGVHLLLASQRLEEGRLKGLDSHLSYRIGLRTFSATESRIVLGVTDAYELPQAPGHGYLKIDQDTMLRFRSSYVSGAYKSRVRTKGRDRPTLELNPQIIPYSVNYHKPARAAISSHPEPLAPKPKEASDSTDTESVKNTLMDVLTRRIAGQGPPAHQVWLPPLDDPPSLDKLFSRLEVSEERGLHAPDWPQGTLNVPIGYIDKPFEQRRDLLAVDLSGAGGNFTAVGGTQSGKSTVLRAVLGSLALTHTPDQVQFYGIDLGGGSLRALSDLPHMGGMGHRQRPDAVRRILAQALQVISDRERRFGDLGIDNVGDYRRMRATGEVDDPLGDVFVVIDGWAAFKDDFYEQMDQVFSIAQRGLAYGVHTMISANRWTDMRPPLRDLMVSRVELKLGDAIDSEIDRKIAKNVPDRAPGRGIVEGGFQILSAVPRIDGKSSAEDLVTGVSKFVERSRKTWKHKPAEVLRMLPREVKPDEIPTWEDGQPLAIGINESRLEPVMLDLDNSPHLMIFGDAECGKTNLLRLIVKQLRQSQAEKPPKFVVVDYRRTMLGEIDDEVLISYSAGPTEAAKELVECVGALQQRLPGPNVTPEQLRARDWWTGSDVYFLIDDYDLVMSQKPNAVRALLPLLPQARDIGVHVVITRRMGGASRAMMDPVLQSLRDLQAPGLLMSGSPSEGSVLGGRVKPMPQPPGRGILMSRDGKDLIQTALSPSKFA
ncbi:type VII secretion protein EccC [Stackebrandtia nassauensis]|uniref:Cell division FtsK/SpoIIIE n=1 Tax=Stackebrandtia nassauensis (strain DSM 44728 / CIP 108903 / NRRL B-16338 / NBRC 102104 / LLR-40K-21) TaxID=446470 RepID=D3Q9Y9_STANL|nr:type VII secretion protein EccC [Stackebrandtia nassauensis]ADD40701.1 cell division FtsK/SpoIIIE [Stackebrandtia nassauensis DSM 44728]